MNFGTDHLRPIWTVFYVEDVGFMLGTAHFNRKKELVDFRPGITDLWTVTHSEGCLCVSVGAPLGQKTVKPLHKLPIVSVGQKRKIDMSRFNVRGRDVVALPIGYRVRPEDEMQVVTVIAFTRYGMSVKEFLQQYQPTRALTQHN